MLPKLLLQVFAAANIALLGICAYSFNPNPPSASSAARSGIGAPAQPLQLSRSEAPLPAGAE